MNLYKTSFFSALQAAIKIASGFIITKVIAVQIGPAGLAIIGQLQSFVTSVTVAASSPVGAGVVKYAAEYSKEENSRRKIYSTAILLALYLSLFSGGVIFFFRNRISFLLFGNAEFESILMAFAILLPLAVLNVLLLSILNGEKRIRVYVGVNIFSSAFAMCIVAAACHFYHLTGALLAIILIQPITFLSCVFFLRRDRILKFKNFNFGFDAVFARKLSRYAAMGITTAITAPVPLILIRDRLGAELTWAAAGYWQAVWKISETYLTLITTSLAVYYLPRLSEIKSREMLVNEISKCYKFIMPITVALAVGIFLSRDFIIRILFSEEFLPMKEFFLFQLIGDVIKIASWILAYLMLAKSMLRQYIIAEVGTALIFTWLSFLLIPGMGVKGVTIAFLITYILYFIYCAIIVFFWIKRNAKNLQNA